MDLPLLSKVVNQKVQFHRFLVYFQVSNFILLSRYILFCYNIICFPETANNIPKLKEQNLLKQVFEAH